MSRGLLGVFRRARSSDFFRQASGASVWNMGGMGLTLLNGVLTSRLLAPDDRGALALILTATALSYLVSSLGTSTAIRVFQGRETWASFRTYLFVSAWLLSLNVLLVFGTAVAFAEFGYVEHSVVLPLILVLGVATFISSQLLDVLNAQGLVSRSASVNNLGHFSTLVALGIIYLAFDGGLLGMVLAAYIAGFVARVVLCILAMRRVGVKLGVVSPDRGRTLIRQGFRFWGINLAQTLTSRADQLLLVALANTYAVGIYAVAVAPASVMQVVSNSVGQVALREAASGVLTAKRLFRACGVAFLVVGFYTALMWFAAPTLIPLVFGADYSDAVPVVRILLLAELARSPYLVLIRALAGLNRPFAATASSLLGLVILAVSMVVLVPKFGVEGAAFSVVITSVILLAVSAVSTGVALNRGASSNILLR